MAMNKLNVPKTITVGFQERSDTYTKRLAYVIYTDTKGVLRKEKSWQGWRDKKIDPEVYDNEPQSGFVLNKKVGGNNYSWNPRNTYVRVFDPRGFEFEISVPNLLFILQESSSIKGKGLEGEFVYAWDGTELVLLPTTSQEYIDSCGHTELQSKKVTKADMVEGCIYKNKDGEIVMYLGRHDWSISDHKYSYEDTNGNAASGYRGYGYGYNDKRRTKISYLVKTEKKHIFAYIGKENNKVSEYWIQGGFTKIGEQVSPDVSPLYADIYDKFKKTCPNVGAKFEIVKELYDVKDHIRNSSSYYTKTFMLDSNRFEIQYNQHNETYKLIKKEDFYVFSQDVNNFTYSYWTYSDDKKTSFKLISKEDIDTLKGEHYYYKNSDNGAVLTRITY